MPQNQMRTCYKKISGFAHRKTLSGPNGKFYQIASLVNLPNFEGEGNTSSSQILLEN